MPTVRLVMAGHSNFIHNSQKLETLHMFVHKCMDEHVEWYLHAMEYHLAIKRNEPSIQAPTWMNIQNIMISERSHSQKSIYYIILLT